MSTAIESVRAFALLVLSDDGGFIRRRLLAVVALVVVGSISSALGPMALRILVDSFAAGTGMRPALPISLIALFVLSQVFGRAVGVVRTMLYAQAERRLCRRLGERLFIHVMRLPYKVHVDRGMGGLSQILANGIQGSQLIVQHSILTCVPVVTELVTMTVVLGRLTTPALLGMFCCAIFCYGTAFVVGSINAAEAARVASSSAVDAAATMTDGILNYETVKYFAAEPLIQGSVDRALARAETEWLAFYRRYTKNSLCVAGIFAFFLAATTVSAARAFQSGHATVGDFVLVTTYVLQVVRPIEAVGYAVQGLSQGWAMLEKLLTLLGETSEPYRGSDCVNRPATGAVVVGSLEFEEVTSSYRSGRATLERLTFKVPAGKTVGIVGPSGSGKSTIVRLLARLIEPDGGSILLGGVPIRDLPLSQLRGSIAVVPQETVLFDDSIAHNIALGKPNCTMTEVVQAAKLARLHDFIMGLPDRYETRVGERGVKLSGGEKQRVSIARAVIKRSPIYVFDEATSSLDTQTERQILASLRDVSRCSTTLVIAHRLSTVVHADEILVLDAGIVTERGTHDALVRGRGLYAELWRAQHRRPGPQPSPCRISDADALEACPRDQPAKNEHYML